MNSNPFAAPESGAEQELPLVEGPANPLLTRIMAALFPLLIGPLYVNLWWTKNSNFFRLPAGYADLGFWLAAAFMLWVAIGGLMSIFDRTRIYADSIDSLNFFRRQVQFHEIAYVQKVTNSPPTIYFIKHDGQEVIIQGGNQQLHEAFLAIAARFPPPA